MKLIRKRITYANVMSSLAVFLVLGGATAFAASKISSGQIKRNAITGAKIKNGAVNFKKLAKGTGVVAIAKGGPIAANQGTGTAQIDIPLSGKTKFTPKSGVVDQLNVEVRGSLKSVGAVACDAEVLPYVNGFPWRVSDGFIDVFAPTVPPSTTFPNGMPLGSETGPVGLTTPGTPVTITAKLIGSAANCTADSTVSVVLAVTQAK